MKDTTKVIRNGTSLIISLTSKDLANFPVKNGTLLNKEFDPSGKTITFKIIDNENQALDGFIDRFYEENKGLTQELESK